MKKTLTVIVLIMVSIIIYSQNISNIGTSKKSTQKDNNKNTNYSTNDGGQSGYNTGIGL